MGAHIPRMVTPKRGEIWLVTLDPTQGHEIKKTRPAIIIQNDMGNKYYHTTIIAPISSQKIQRVYPHQVGLPEKTKGLNKKSKILLDQIRVIDKLRVVKRLGKQMESGLQKQVDEALKISLGLNI